MHNSRYGSGGRRMTGCANRGMGIACRQMVGQPKRQRHDRQRWIGLAGCREYRAACNVQIVDPEHPAIARPPRRSQGWHPFGQCRCGGRHRRRLGAARVSISPSARIQPQVHPGRIRRIPGPAARSPVRWSACRCARSASRYALAACPSASRSSDQSHPAGRLGRLFGVEIQAEQVPAWPDDDRREFAVRQGALAHPVHQEPGGAERIGQQVAGVAQPVAGAPGPSPASRLPYS